jgi:hypothetical protein
MAVMFQFEVFRGVTPCSDVLGTHVSSYLHPEDGGSIIIRNVSILQHHYTVLL